MQSTSQVREFTPSLSLDPLAELRRELMNWAEPIIADRILDGYRRVVASDTDARYLSGQHRRLWRAILLEKRSILALLRQELDEDLLKAGLDRDVADVIDQGVIEELIDIVLKRFRASSERVKGFSMVLLGAASHLSPPPAVTYS
jgi:hypothetical protein